MPNTREKLIELLSQAQDNGIMQGNHITHIAHISNQTVADHLIANGVTISKMETVATDNNVGHKWISVKDRLPSEEDAIEGGFVLANTEEKVIIALWSDVCRFNEFVTHWMPLPQPPKGE